MPTYADLSGWVISIIAGRFEVIADRLGVGRRFVEKEIESGRLRVRRLSRRMIRIMPADIKDWMDKGNTITSG